MGAGKGAGQEHGRNRKKGKGWSADGQMLSYLQQIESYLEQIQPF